MSDQYSVLAPEDVPSIAVGSMNDTHHEELALVNALGDLLIRAKGGEVDVSAITAALNDWIVHTEAHFSRENQLMEAYGFPPYPVHAQEHDAALEGLQSVQQLWRDKQEVDELVEFVFTSWPQWFQMHVNSMDNVTARFLSNFVE
jgi:hemerythrin